MRGINLNWKAYNTFACSINDEVNDDNEENHDNRPTDEEIPCKAYEAFKARILHFGKIEDFQPPSALDGPIVVPYSQLRAHRYGGIRTIPTHKSYRPIIINAQIVGNYRVMPFGY